MSALTSSNAPVMAWTMPGWFLHDKVTMRLFLPVTIECCYYPLDNGGYISAKIGEGKKNSGSLSIREPELSRTNQSIVQVSARCLAGHRLGSGRLPGHLAYFFFDALTDSFVN